MQNALLVQLASTNPAALQVLLELKKEERRKAEEERRKAEEERKKVEAHLELKKLQQHHSRDGSVRTPGPSPGGTPASNTASPRSPNHPGGSPGSPTGATAHTSLMQEQDPAMLISNLVLHDVPTEVAVYEFSVLYKKGARSALAAAMLERGLWGRIQRMSPIEVSCVVVSELPGGEGRLIEFVNWLRTYARWDRPHNGPMPANAGRRAIMIGTCLLVDPNDGIHASGDLGYVGLLGTRVEVKKGYPTGYPLHHAAIAQAPPHSPAHGQGHGHGHGDRAESEVSMEPKGLTTVSDPDDEGSRTDSDDSSSAVVM